MTAKDRHGLSTTGSQEAVALYDRLAEGYLWFEADLLTRMDAVSAAGVDEAPPMGSILWAQLMAMSHTSTGVAAAREVADALDGRALLAREEHHRRALAAVGVGDVDGATAAWGAVLDEHPGDLVALRLQHFALFNRGALGEMTTRAESTGEHLARHGAAVARDLALVDGMRSFAHEEGARFAEAERLGKNAVATAPDDLWAIHAVAHVLEMQGRSAEGRSWVDANAEALRTHGSFAGHVWWHLALCHLETGAHSEALRLYDDGIWAPDATEGLTLTNAIALLARLEWAGADVGGRWADLVDGASLRIGHHSHPFNDCHYTYALARAGRDDLAEELHLSMCQWGAERNDTAAEVIRGVAASTALGMLDLGRGRPAEAARELARDREQRWRIGGSHAQRDLFAQAELRALIDSGEAYRARGMAATRVLGRPDSARNQRWLADATVAAERDVALARADELGWVGEDN